jgi:hypothetical protein
MPLSPSRLQHDARTLSIVRASVLVRMLDGLVTLVIAAWADSIVVAMWRRCVDRLTTRTTAGRVRLGGGVMVVASVTALVMQRFSSRPAPLTWMVPALFLFAGVCLMAAARQRSAP